MDSLQRPRGQFGLAALLVLVAIPALAIVGGQFAYNRWGLWPGVLGAVLGGVLAVPLVGIFFSLMIGMATCMEKLRRR